MDVPHINSSQPATGSRLVVPHDTNDLNPPARGVYVAGAGAIRFIGADGVTDTVTCPAGAHLNVVMTRIYATGTTSGEIHAFK